MDVAKLEAIAVERKDELQQLQRKLQLIEIDHAEVSLKIMRKTIEVEDAEIALGMASE